MSVIVILTANTLPDSTDKFVTILEEILPDTRAYKGCINLEVYRNMDNATQITLVEEWESRQDYEAYFAWRTETGTLDRLIPLFDGEPSITYLDKIGI